MYEAKTLNLIGEFYRLEKDENDESSSLLFEQQGRDVFKTSYDQPLEQLQMLSLTNEVTALLT